MKIGFYGDSFCCEISNPHSVLNNYNTYIKKIKKYFNANITHLGVGGSSAWDIILNQFNANNIPDVCIFVWTDYNRLYNKKVRNITEGSVSNKRWKDFSFNDLVHRNIIKSAESYFKYLHDYEKAKLEYLSALQYFDLNVLSKVNSQIIHLWSFSKEYDWKNGKEIFTPLISLTKKDKDLSANHINGEENNRILFELIKDQIQS